MNKFLLQIYKRASVCQDNFVPETSKNKNEYEIKTCFYFMLPVYFVRL